MLAKRAYAIKEEGTFELARRYLLLFIAGADAPYDHDTKKLPRPASNSFLRMQKQIAAHKNQTLA